MNHRKLLVKYMALVGDCEGIHFLDFASPEYFTKDEQEELNAISKESLSVTVP